MAKKESPQLLLFNYTPNRVDHPEEIIIVDETAIALQESIDQSRQKLMDYIHEEMHSFYERHGNYSYSRMMPISVVVKLPQTQILLSCLKCKVVETLVVSETSWQWHSNLDSLLATNESVCEKQ